MGKSTVKRSNDQGNRNGAACEPSTAHHVIMDIALAVDGGGEEMLYQCERRSPEAKTMIWQDCGMLAYLRDLERQRPHTIMTRPPRLQTTEVVRAVGDALYHCIRCLDEGGALCLLLEPGVDEDNYSMLLGLVGGVGEVARMHHVREGTKDAGKTAVLLGIRDSHHLPRIDVPSFDWVDRDDQVQWHAPVVREELLAAIVMCTSPTHDGRVADPFASDDATFVAANGMGRHAFGRRTKHQSPMRGARVLSLFGDKPPVTSGN